MVVTNPFSPSSWTKRQVDAVSRGWWVLLITGVLSIVAGGIILTIDWTVSDLAVFVGALLVFRGIFTMFSIPVDGALRGWSIALGALETLVGVAVWTWPGPTLLVIAFAIGWWVLFSGIMTIAGSITGRGVLPYWGLMLAFGILETLFAFWLLARPNVLRGAIAQSVHTATDASLARYLQDRLVADNDIHLDLTVCIGH